jgi:hypothetical protein
LLQARAIPESQSVAYHLQLKPATWIGSTQFFYLISERCAQVHVRPCNIDA